MRNGAKGDKSYVKVPAAYVYIYVDIYTLYYQYAVECILIRCMILQLYMREYETIRGVIIQAPAAAAITDPFYGYSGGYQPANSADISTQ